MTAIDHSETVATIGFVDLVRFTSLTDVHGDLAGADAAATLLSITEDVLGGATRLVKTAGDGVLLASENPRAGLHAAAEVIERLHDLTSGLDARGGIAHGPLVERDGDVFGSTVNLAARLCAIADPGSLALTRPIALAARDEDLSVVPLGPTRLSGFSETVEVFRVDPCQHGIDWVTVPVCGMRLRADHAISRRVVDGSEIGFCSMDCVERFQSSE